MVAGRGEIAIRGKGQRQARMRALVDPTPNFARGPDNETMKELFAFTKPKPLGAGVRQIRQSAESGPSGRTGRVQMAAPRA